MSQNNLAILPSQEYREEPTTKLHSKVFNAFWIVLLGIPSVILNFVLGISLCVSILGIPAGIMCFKYIPFIFHPAGREWKLYYGKHPFLNTMNFLFGGLETYLVQVSIGIVLCITIIGIPLGLQYFKAANFHLAPFGAKVQIANSYTESLDHRSDYFQLRMQMRLDDKTVKLSDGKTCLASQAMRKVVDEKEKKCVYNESAVGQAKMTPVECVAAAIFVSLLFQGIAILISFIIYAAGGMNAETFVKIVLYSNLWHVLYLLITFIIFIPAESSLKRALKVFQAKFRPLTTYYPKQYNPKDLKKIFKR